MKNLILGLILATSVNSFAGKEGGGENLINGYTIEHYSHDITDETDPEFLLVWDSTLVLLREVAVICPKWKELLEKKATSLFWYKVPVELNELPSEVTGLDFTSKQAAIQNPETKEVFISGPQFDKASTKDLKLTEQGIIVFHELVLSTIAYTNNPQMMKTFEAKTRQVVSIFLKAYYDRNYNMDQALVVAKKELKEKVADGEYYCTAIAYGMDP